MVFLKQKYNKKLRGKVHLFIIYIYKWNKSLNLYYLLKN
jgi:hypothetical protein